MFVGRDRIEDIAVAKFVRRRGYLKKTIARSTADNDDEDLTWNIEPGEEIVGCLILHAGGGVARRDLSVLIEDEKHIWRRESEGERRRRARFTSPTDG